MNPHVRLRAGLAAAALALTLAGLTGCYEHVVSAKGVGGDRVDISKPNAPRDSGDRILGYPKVEPRAMPGSQ